MTNNSMAGGLTSAAGRGVATTPHPADSLVVRSLTGLHRLAQLYTEYHAADSEVNYTVFHSAVEPTIPFPDYALRLNRHLDAGDDAMLLSLVLIGRYSQHTGMLPSVLTVHRLFLAALRVVTKTLHDITRTTPSYARAGGIHLSELCRLERHLLVGVGFGVFFKHSDLDFFKHHMSLSLQQQHGHSDHAVGFAAIAMHLPLPHSVLALDFAGAVAEEVLHHTAAEHLPARSVTAETPQHDVLEGSPSPIMSASLPNLLQAPASLAATSFEALRVAEGDEHHVPPMSDEHLFKTSFDGCVADEGRSSSTTTSGGAGCVAARALRSSRDIPQ